MTIDPRTIAADIMCNNARDITPIEIHAHIGHAYDEVDAEAADVDTIAELIAKTGIDLIWPDGSTNTELDAARVEIERRDAELAALRADIDDRDSEISTLRQDLDLQTKAAWDNNAKVAELTAELDRVRADLAAAHNHAHRQDTNLHQIVRAKDETAAERDRIKVGLHYLTVSTDGLALNDAEEIPVGEIRRVLGEAAESGVSR